jgi:hypothetical protein
MHIFLSALTLLGVFAGIFISYQGITMANGAPQEAAAAAVGLVCAVLPYILLKISYCGHILKNQREIIKLLEELQEG